MLLEAIQCYLLPVIYPYDWIVIISKPLNVSDTNLAFKTTDWLLCEAEW